VSTQSVSVISLTWQHVPTPEEHLQASSGISSENLDKRNLQTPEPTRHQILRPKFHNKKKNEFGQTIHNIETRTAKPNSKNPVFRTHILLQHILIIKPTRCINFSNLFLE